MLHVRCITILNSYWSTLSRGETILGAFCLVAKIPVNFALDEDILAALDAYRDTLKPRPSRAFVMSAAIADYLRARNITIPISEPEPEA